LSLDIELLLTGTGPAEPSILGMEIPSRITYRAFIMNSCGQNQSRPVPLLAPICDIRLVSWKLQNLDPHYLD
jgi:hypothetical protein